MARIKYPHDFLKQTELFKKIKAKHDADGAGSVLNPYLSEQGINMDKDKSDTDKAITKNKLFDKAEKEAEDYTQDRNTLFDPAFANMKDGFQFLKKLYRGNPAELGHWGATVNGNAIVHPPDFLKRVELFKTYKAKHDSYPAGSSPLAPFLSENKIDMDDDETDVTAAKAKHKSAKQTEKDAEDLREERDKLFDPVMEHVRGMGQYLKGLYVKHPKHLGQWGYTVDDSPPKPRRHPRSVPAGGQITIKKVIGDTEFRNAGGTILVLCEESTPTEEGISVDAGDKANIPKSFTTLSIVNQNSDQKGKCSLVY